MLATTQRQKIRNLFSRKKVRKAIIVLAFAAPVLNMVLIMAKESIISSMMKKKLTNIVAKTALKKERKHKNKFYRNLNYD